MTHRLGFHGDLPLWAAIIACTLGALSIAVLVFRELRGREPRGVSVAATGILSVLALVGAVLRPVRIFASESSLGAKVTILLDESRSMQLPSGTTGTRADVAKSTLESVKQAASSARVTLVSVGDGAAHQRTPDSASTAYASFTDAIQGIMASQEERPQALVLLSDGRFDDGVAAPMARLPIHTILTAAPTPIPDASIRRIEAAGAAVAHVPLPVRVEVGCDPSLSCDELTVTARELRDGASAELASGVAKIHQGKGIIDLTLTLERTGTRLVEFSIQHAEKDTVPENDKRLIAFSVARERVRLLHVAGRPTSDVSALRQWLKSNSSIDLIAFFILRTQSDNPKASSDDLSLIPFPVDELFTEHLPSFDAVILQDFDAQPYGFEKHMPNVARYVKGGGGLIMVGGPNAFVAGGYAGTAVADVLPVVIERPNGSGADLSSFSPAWAAPGRSAPLLAPLREVLGDDLPAMPGANVLGDVRPGSIALWTHPTRVTKSGVPMPVLVIGDQGEGRSIALGIDGAWQLVFSEVGARTAGRGYAALWDGLLGWLMHDPRFEPAVVELAQPCISNTPTSAKIHASYTNEAVEVEVRRLDRSSDPPIRIKTAPNQPAVVVPSLPTGGYAAIVHLPNGTTSRSDFACEAGGADWADSRPDLERLRAIAEASGGTFELASKFSSLPLPRPTTISAERTVTPLLPAWAWSLLAAVLLGAHWVIRRRSGLA